MFNSGQMRTTQLISHIHWQPRRAKTPHISQGRMEIALKAEWPSWSRGGRLCGESGQDGPLFPQDLLLGIILWASREVKPIRLRTRLGTADLANKGTRTFLANKRHMWEEQEHEKLDPWGLRGSKMSRKNMKIQVFQYMDDFESVTLNQCMIVSPQNPHLLQLILLHYVQTHRPSCFVSP